MFVPALEFVTPVSQVSVLSVEYVLPVLLPTVVSATIMPQSVLVALPTIPSTQELVFCATSPTVSVAVEFQPVPSAAT